MSNSLTLTKKNNPFILGNKDMRNFITLPPILEYGRPYLAFPGDGAGLHTRATF